MKVGIVTVYNSMNCGSFLQAYALWRTLEEKGHQAVCVYHNFSDHSIHPTRYGKKVLKAAMRGRFAVAKRLVRSRKIFQQALKLLRVEKNSGDIACYVLGSDTIWDLTVPFFRNHREFFWGTAFDNARVISYAPSMGYARQVESGDREFISGALNRMDAVSVRDRYARELLQPYYSQPIPEVCDPTILLKPADYAKIAKPLDMKDFIFLYFYEKLPQSYVQQLQAYARQRGLKIVAMGNSNLWCDVCVPFDPLLFLSLYEKAESIVTNTFHGTVFSNIYEKKFLVIKNEKPKIINFLKLCRMSDKMSETPEDVPKILNSQFHYDVTREILKQEREAGIDYLMKGLEQ